MSLVGYVRIPVSPGHEVIVGGTVQTEAGPVDRQPLAWESTDGGRSFRLIAARILAEDVEPLDGMMGVAIHGDTRTTLRIFGSKLGGGQDTYRVFDSLDFGRSWARVPLEKPCGIPIMGGLVGVGPGGSLFVGGGMIECSPNDGVVRSDDMGMTWTRDDAVAGAFPAIVCRRMPMPPTE
jgi:hypothetical protein